MSTGRRLAKRSIIGTKVCAPGPDGLWYSGVIQAVKTPPSVTNTSPNSSSSSSSSSLSSSCSSSSLSPSDTNITADTNYIVRFDFKTQHTQNMLDGSSSKSVIMEARRAANAHISPTQTLRRNAMIKEFRESDLIGPGFRSIIGIQLQPGQRVFLTYNGRETSGDVVSHDADKDEVIVKIMAIGTEEPIELKKRLEEVRLLESRRSARLADQERDTDFARLADMGGDRRRTTNSIEVPLSLTPQHNSRKRPPSFSQNGDKTDMDESFPQDGEMDECNAALILMKLSTQSPQNAEKWFSSSPGSSSASWSSGSSSPPLSDDGHALNSTAMLNDTNARIRTTSVSTSDEGIVVDFKEETPRKKKANKKYKCTWKGCKLVEHTLTKIERHIRNAHLGNKKARRSADYDGSCSENDHEEEFYYTEIEDDDDEGKTPSPTSPPTLSHFDMARPPHEDPDYQRQFVGTFKQGRVSQQQQQQLQHQTQQQQHHGGKTIHTSYMPASNSPQQQQQQSPHMQQSNCLSTSPLAHHNYTWSPSSANAASVTVTPTTSPQSHSTHGTTQQQQQQPPYSPVSHIRHPRSSPRPSQAAAPYPSPTYTHHNQQQPHQQHHNYSSSHANSNSGHSGSSSSSTPIIHGNSNANNMLQQLSQQNITVTAHHSGTGSSVNHSPQQQHQVPAVTITPNYHPHQSHHQQQHSQQQHHSHQSQQQQSQSQSQSQHIRGHHQAPHSQTTASNMVAIQHSAAPAHLHTQHPQHASVQQAVATATRHTPNSPNRRTRGENKKCRKVYGMDRRDQWCTQCRWKKACTRFGD